MWTELSTPSFDPKQPWLMADSCGVNFGSSFIHFLFLSQKQRNKEYYGDCEGRFLIGLLWMSLRRKGPSMSTGESGLLANITAHRGYSSSHPKAAVTFFQNSQYCIRNKKPYHKKLNSQNKSQLLNIQLVKTNYEDIPKSLWKNEINTWVYFGAMKLESHTNSSMNVLKNSS